MNLVFDNHDLAAIGVVNDQLVGGRQPMLAT